MADRTGATAASQRPSTEAVTTGKGSTLKRPPLPPAGETPTGGGRVSITGSAGAVSAMLAEEQAKPSDGYGGWEEIERPRRKAVTSFKGAPNMKMTVPVMVDGFLTDTPVDQAITTLETMAQIGAGFTEPPSVRVTGAGVPHTDLVWVIEDLEWGDALFSDAGLRTRQFVTVKLLEYTSDESIITVEYTPPTTADCEAASSAVKNYKVKAGDTLQSIAAEHLLAASCWQRIAKLNKLRDPKRIKVGQTLKLP